MSAVLVRIEPPEDLERRLDGRDRSALDNMLNDWGSWHEEHKEFEGYPRCDPVARSLDSPGGGSSGHRILCLDMPVRVFGVHARYLLLPEHEREVVWANYVPTQKEGGGQWTTEEKAERLGLTWATYRKRLSRARVRMLGLDPDYLEKRRN